VRVSINDNGSGLSEIRVDEIFEPFVTGDRNFKRPQTIGMGLAIAKSIIERNNGTIGVENQTVGVRFYFDLPATTADAA
jgi:signal transduction histidine kinase